MQYNTIYYRTLQLTKLNVGYISRTVHKARKTWEKVIIKWGKGIVLIPGKCLD